MKEVWVFRHGPTDYISKNLEPEAALKKHEGIELVMGMVDFLDGVTFKRIFTSPFVRAYQTGVVLALMLGIDFPIIIPGLGTKDIGRWDEILKGIQRYSCADFYRRDSDFIADEGAALFYEILHIATECGDDERVLCISHNGLIESAVACVLYKYKFFEVSFKEVLLKINDFKECEGVVFYFDSGNRFLNIFERRRP